MTDKSVNSIKCGTKADDSDVLDYKQYPPE